MSVICKLASLSFCHQALMNPALRSQAYRRLVTQNLLSGPLQSKRALLNNLYGNLCQRQGGSKAGHQAKALMSLGAMAAYMYGAAG